MERKPFLDTTRFASTHTFDQLFCSIKEPLQLLNRHPQAFANLLKVQLNQGVRKKKLCSFVGIDQTDAEHVHVGSHSLMPKELSLLYHIYITLPTFSRLLSSVSASLVRTLSRLATSSAAAGIAIFSRLALVSR